MVRTGEASGKTGYSDEGRYDPARSDTLCPFNHNPPTLRFLTFWERYGQQPVLLHSRRFFRINIGRQSEEPHKSTVANLFDMHGPGRFG